MKYILSCLLAICSLSAFSQNTIYPRSTSFKGPDVICPGHFEDHFSKAREAVLKANRARVGAKKSTFIVTYVGFSEEAKQAFQRAVDIWEYLIYSEVPIRVYAEWRPLASNILGSANTSDFLQNFEGAPYSNTYYPMALAEKLAGKPLNSDDQEDIYCRFNNSINWHYGEPEEITNGKFDLTTVVLHELGHGLGFISTFSVSGQTASYGYGTPYKSVYDVYLEDQSGRNLVDPQHFTNGTQALYRQITNNNLFFQLDGERPKIYAPSSFIVGSSVSHLDDNTYAPGTINALMTSTSRSMEVTHDPGPLSLGILYELGWKSTSLVHERIKNQSTYQPITFQVKVLSDTTIKSGSVKLNYQVNGGSYQIVDLERSGEVYKATLNFPENVTTVNYYFEAEDDFNKKIYAPGLNGVNTERYIYSFSFGEDKSAPLAYHSPFSVEDVQSAKIFRVLAEDDYQAGISEVRLLYSVNNGTFNTVKLQKYDPQVHGSNYSLGIDDPFQYLSINPINGLKTGDLIRYRFEVEDASKNVTIIPLEFTGSSSNPTAQASYYEFTVTSLLPAVNSYSTDFESSVSDFALLGFNIGKEGSFPTNALHSSHPYRNGLGLRMGNSTVMSFERNEIAMLRAPIIVGRGENTLITFDEVVLVEPGESGSQYESQDFYDYVVVEGSFDGVNWTALEDGYDSRANNTWNSLFTENMEGVNSSAKGHVALSRNRTMLVNTGAFGSNVGSQMLLRFRLYSDELSNGWGWVIDNLYIQKNAPVILGNEEVRELHIYPVPVSDYLVIQAKVSSKQNVKLSILSSDGKTVLAKEYNSNEDYLHYTWDIQDLPSGSYILQVKDKEKTMTKRFIKI